MKGERFFSTFFSPRQSINSRQSRASEGKYKCERAKKAKTQRCKFNLSKCVWVMKTAAGTRNKPRMTDLFISHLSITGPHSFSSTLASINLFGKFSTLLNNNKNKKNKKNERTKKKTNNKRIARSRAEVERRRHDGRTGNEQVMRGEERGKKSKLANPRRRVAI